MRLALALSVFVVSGCGKMAAHRVGQISQSSQSNEALAFDRVGVPAVAKLQVSLAGTCIHGSAIEVTATDSVARVVSCPPGGRFTLDVTLAGADGAKTIAISSFDGAGRAWSDSVTVMKDTTPPALSILGAVCQGTSRMVSGVCESGSTVTISGSLMATAAATCASGTFQAPVQFTLGDGLKNVEISQTDSAGNIGRATGSCTVSPNPTPTAPVVTIQTPAALAYVKNTARIIGACTNGIPVVLYGAGVSANVSAACSAGMYSGDVTLTPGEGAKEIRAGQTNSTGQSAVATVMVNKDTLAPSLTIAQPAAGTIAATGVTIQGACESGLNVNLAGTGLASPVQTMCSSMAYSAPVVFSSGTGAKAVTVSQTDSAGNVASVSRSFTKGDVVIDGTALYTTNCAGCHGGLAMSTKRNRTSAQISGAIASVGSMAGLSRLTTAEVAAIAAALGAKPADVAPTTDVDKLFSATNPTLYSAGRKYFPSDEGSMPAKRIARLTRKQLDVTVKSLLPTYHTTSLLTAMPRDPLQTNYEYAEIININASNFTPLNDWVQQIVSRVKANPLGVINCAASGNSAACLQTQARAFLLKAFRADVSEAKITQYSNFLIDSVAAVGINEATGDFVDLVLTSPQFLYRDEFTVDANGKLVAPEHLEALTYILADAPPEQVKLSSATAATQMQTPSSVKTTSDAVIATPEAREKLMRFFASWLEIKDPAEFTISTTDYPEFTPAVANAVVDETTKFLNFHLTKAAPKLKDITQSTQSFVSQSLASIYELSPNGLTGNTMVNLDPNKRLGIFSQSAVLASHSGPTTTRLVKRGVFWVRKVMCQELEPPPASVNTMLPTTMDTTERKKIETATAQSACIGCHNVINPLGFFQENYNPIGKWRTTDNGFPVDSSINTNILDEGNLNTDKPVEALRAFTNSAMFKQCFVRQLFRYYMGRNETPADHRTLREMFFYFADGDNQDILTLLQILSNSERMSKRQ